MAKKRSGRTSGRQLKDLPELFLERILPGAGRAGGQVVADAARELLGSKRVDTANGGSALIADALKIRIRREGTIIRGKITMEGPGSSVGRWLEYGTAPHFISVANVRLGVTAARANRRLKDGDAALHASLFINGTPVGPTVYHSGARAFPFLRPAYDANMDAIVPAMLAYMAKRITRAGVISGPDIEADA
ncbi:HK97 gp10 family phage protein [Sphingomonas sp. XXL09]|uniref:HK97 gp10 family phage protein n=1 Tax=Sphingomonas sp. XXL09 TaxID=3457787 RepID=UPI00406BC31E